MGGIFINYRREDAAPWAGRLYERLAREFPRNQLLIDVDSIEPGLDFVRVLEELVSGCDVLVAIIGPTWVEARNEEGLRRLDDPDDFVRIELDSALKRDIRVIPVLVDGAPMPRAEKLPEPLKPLARRNAVRVSHERFGADTQGLVEVLQRLTNVGAPAPAGSPSSSTRQRARAPASPPVAPEQGEAPVLPEERRKMEEAKARQRAEEEARRLEAETKRRAEEEEGRRRAEAKQRADEEEGRRRAEAEAPQRAEEERSRHEAEAKRRAESRTPIVVASVFALASLPITWFGWRSLSSDAFLSSGALAGAMLVVVSALALVRRRGAEIRGTEVALYWLGSSLAIACTMVSLFDLTPNGFLAGGMLAAISGVILLIWRRRAAA